MKHTEAGLFAYFWPVKKHALLTLALVFIVLLFDQALKIYVKTHFRLGEEYHVSGDWFIIHFTENPGMAFGLELGGDWGKMALSIFRLLAVTAIGYAGWLQIKKGTSRLMLVCIALIFAGALGNIIDSCFYGMMFSESDYFEAAKFMPAEGGYAGFLHGRVVDMFYFPVIEGHFPGWFPFWGGEEFIFFRPVFNVADASISVGVILLIIFQKRLFGKKKETKEEKAEEKPAETPAPETPQDPTAEPAQ
ncbi:MAG: signal peptidase II [Bacteroidetes bacterium]|nr:MAG: signal peptidase II [Bacteroidota bacterium]